MIHEAPLSKMHNERLNVEIPAEAAFNVEVAIAEMISDEERHTVVFPHMTPAERNHAKSIVARHLELKCESYGIGADRKLHIFKAVTSPFTSNIVKLRGIEQRSSSHTSAVVDDDGVSTCASASASLSTQTNTALSAFNDPEILDPESSPLPQGLHVRNTFICGDDDIRPVDDRIVKSMPHGMFRQRLLQEVEALISDVNISEDVEDEVSEGSLVFPATPPADYRIQDLTLVPRQSSKQQSYTSGAEVIIEGLMKLPAFNGMQGSVQSIDEKTGRYNVLMTQPIGPTGQRWAKVKAENLRPASSSPTLWASSNLTLIAGAATPQMQQWFPTSSSTLHAR